MKAFIDTSSLIKKYVEEKGSIEFNDLLDSVSEIIVSPVTILELHSAIERRVRERSLSRSVGKWIKKEFLSDYEFFALVEWSDDLVAEGLRVIHTHQLRVLDGIQLSAGLISKAGLFVTSDKRLSMAAGQEIRDVRLI